MFELILIGLIGGIVTGISPCILPVLPIVLAVSVDRKPTHVISGLALSFATITLVGTLILGALGLPKDVLRWGGIALLVLVGIGMIVPKLGEWIEAPFSRIPRPTSLQLKARNKGGFAIGLALGAVYVPCAGPILAAITVAGATGDIGLSTVILTVAFAVGASLPLLVFAFAGNKMGERIAAVQKHRGIVGGIILALALALALNVPEKLQRSLPDWTAGVQEQISGNEVVQNALNSGGNGNLDSCRNADKGTLHDCGEAPEFEGLTGWFNTDQPVGTHDGNVTLVDFWAYACINCQRAGEHITKLYDTYKDAGLQVVGVHAPEYSFEHEASNVRAAAEREGINYPVAQDNDFITWKKFNNRFWPARYLIDAQGNVRHIHEGEGAYAETEQLVRQLLKQANPNVELPDPIETDGDADANLTEQRNPETYLGAERARYFNNDNYGSGEREFTYKEPSVGQYSLSGKWNVKSDHIIPVEDAKLSINVHAAKVQLVVSGQGKVKATFPDGSSKTFDVADGSIDVYEADEPLDGIITLEPESSVTAYSLTFG